MCTTDRVELLSMSILGTVTNYSKFKAEGAPSQVPSKLDLETPTNSSISDNAEESALQAKLPPKNPCILCFKEEKRLACVPCGHLAICQNCTNDIRVCPICRRSIEVFVRVYT